MFGLIAGGVAILLGGIWIACKVLEHQNEERQARYERLRDTYNREMRRRTEDLDRISRCDHVVDRYEALRAARDAADRAEKSAYNQWKEVQRTIWTLGEQLKAAFDRKSELKDGLDAYKRKHRRNPAWNRWDDPQFQVLLNQVREIARFCQCVIESRDKLLRTEEEFRRLRDESMAQQERAQLALRQFDQKLHRFTCVCCGEQFTMTSSEIRWFHGKGLYYPRRCPNCRNLRALEYA